MMYAIIFFGSLLGIYISIISVVFWLEGRQTKDVIHFNWLYNTGLHESVRIVYPAQAKRRLR